MTVDLDYYEREATDPSRGYRYIEVLPDEMLELIREIREARARG